MRKQTNPKAPELTNDLSLDGYQVTKIDRNAPAGEPSSSQGTLARRIAPHHTSSVFSDHATLDGDPSQRTAATAAAKQGRRAAGAGASTLSSGLPLHSGPSSGSFVPQQSTGSFQLPDDPAVLFKPFTGAVTGRLPAPRKLGATLGPSHILDGIVPPPTERLAPGATTREDLSVRRRPGMAAAAAQLSESTLEELFPGGLHATDTISALENARAEFVAQDPIQNLLNPEPPSLLSAHASQFPVPSLDAPISLDQALLRVDLADDIPQGISTGEEAITLLMREKHREGQAFYCIFTHRSPLEYEPYDLTVIRRSQIQPSTPEYFIVSVSGVTHLRTGDVCDVLELQDWLQQKAVFSMIRKYDFFRNFAKRKFFFLWRAIARDMQFRRARLKVAQNLLHLDPTVGLALIKINGLISDGCNAAVGKDQGAVGGWIKGSDGRWRTLDDHQHFVLEQNRTKRSKKDAREAEMIALELTTRIRNRAALHVITEALRSSGNTHGMEAPPGSGGHTAAAIAPSRRGSVTDPLSSPAHRRESVGMPQGLGQGSGRQGPDKSVERPLTVHEMRARAEEVIKSMRKQLGTMEENVVDVLTQVRVSLESAYVAALPKSMNAVEKWEHGFVGSREIPWPDQSISAKGAKERGVRDEIHAIRKEADKLKRLVRVSDLILMETVAMSCAQAVRDMYTTLNELSGLFMVRLRLKDLDQILAATEPILTQPRAADGESEGVTFEVGTPRGLTAAASRTSRSLAVAKAYDMDFWTDVFALEKVQRDPLALEDRKLTAEEAAKGAGAKPELRRSVSFSKKKGEGAAAERNRPEEESTSQKSPNTALRAANRRTSQLGSTPTAPSKAMSLSVRESMGAPLAGEIAGVSLGPDGTVSFTPQHGVSDRYRRGSTTTTASPNRRASVGGRRVSFLPGNDPAAALTTALKDAVPDHIVIETTVDDLSAFVPWLVESMIDMYQTVRPVRASDAARLCNTLRLRVLRMEDELTRQSRLGPTAHRALPTTLVVSDPDMAADALAAGMDFSPPPSPPAHHARRPSGYPPQHPETEPSFSTVASVVIGGRPAPGSAAPSPLRPATNNNVQTLTRIPTVKLSKEIARTALGLGPLDHDTRLIALGIDSEPPSVRTILSAYLRNLTAVEDFSLRLRVDFFAALTHILLKPLLATGHVYRMVAAWDPTQFDDPETSADLFYRFLTGSRSWLKILTDATESVTIGLITLDAALVKKSMIPMADKILKALTDQVSRAVGSQCRKLRGRCQEAVKSIRQRPKELSDFTDFILTNMPHLNASGEARLLMEQEYNIARRLYNLLATDALAIAATAGAGAVPTEISDREALERQLGTPLKVDSVLTRFWNDAQKAYDEYEIECQQALEFVNSYRGVAASALMRSTLEAEAQVRELMKNLRSPVLCSLSSPLTDVMAELDACEPLLGQLVGALDQYSRHQEILKASIIGKLQVVVEEAKQLWKRKKELWAAIGVWREFTARLNAPLVHMDGLLTSEDVIQKIHVVEDSIALIEAAPLVPTVYDSSGCTADEKAMAEDIRVKLEGVRLYMPILGVLYHAHMKERHRKVLFRRLMRVQSGDAGGSEGSEDPLSGDPDADGTGAFTMKGMLTLILESEDAKRWLNDIFKIAKREAELMDMLDSMQRSLYAMIILIEKEPDTDLGRIANIIDCQRRLHDCIADVDTLMNSKYIEGISRAFSHIQVGMHHMKRVLTAARECQEGVITLLRLQKRMGGSYWAKLRGFEVLEAAQKWTSIMDAVAETPKLVKACSEGGPLEGAIALNEDIQNLLSTSTITLEDARQIFPRLYLVDDRGLVRALSRGGDLRVNNWVVEACFPGIASCNVIASGPRQSCPGVYGRSGEYVEFGRTIEAGSQKELPFVLCDLESYLLTVLRATTSRSFKSLAQLPGMPTLEEEQAPMGEHAIGPLQTVIVLEMLLWTLTITDSLLAIQRGDRDAMQRAEASLQEDIEQLYLLASGGDEEEEEAEAAAPPAHPSRDDRMSTRSGKSVRHRSSRGSPSHDPADAKARRISGIYEHPEDRRHSNRSAGPSEFVKSTRLRKTHMLSALALAIVNRDRTRDLIDQGIESPSDFVWIRQARYYFDMDVGTAVVMVGDNRFQYGYEYDGGDVENSLMPAVISTSMPQVLSMAASLHFSPCHALRSGSGALPPAYAVKSLARALGRLYHETPCSPAWNAASLTRVLRGAIECGALVLLDRGEVLSHDLLSLLSQHIRDLSTAVKSTAQRCDLCIGQPVNLFRVKPQNLAHAMGIFIGLPAEGATIPSRLDTFARRVCRSVVLQPVPQTPLFSALFMGYGLESEGSHRVALAFSRLLRVLEAHFPRNKALARQALGLRVLRELHDRLNGPQEGMTVEILVRILRMSIEQTVAPLVGSDLQEVLTLLSEEFLLSVEQEERTMGVQSKDPASLQFFEPIRPILIKAFESIAREIRTGELIEEAVVPAVLRMIQTLSTRRSVLLLGAAGAGKSLVLKTFLEAMHILMSQDSKQAAVRKVYPATLTLQDLVGDTSMEADYVSWSQSVLGVLMSRHTTTQHATGGTRRITGHGTDHQRRRMSSMGVTEFRRLPFELREKLSALMGCTDFLVFDGNLGGDVADALAPVLAEGCIFPPDGSISALTDSCRLIWECPSLRDAPPSLLTDIGLVAVGKAVVKLTHPEMRTCLEARLSDLPVAITSQGIRFMSQIILQAIRAAHEMGPDRHMTWELGMAGIVVDLIADLFYQVDVTGAPTVMVDPNAVHTLLDIPEPVMFDEDGFAVDSWSKNERGSLTKLGGGSGSEAMESLESVHSQSEMDVLHPIYRRLLGYVLAWTLGASLDRRAQSMFELRLREYGALEIGEGSRSIYQCFVDVTNGELVPCGIYTTRAQTRLEYGITISESMYEDTAQTVTARGLYFPTGPTLALQHAVRVHLRSGRPALVVGPPSCGKTEAISRVLRSFHGASMVYMPLSVDQKAPDLAKTLKSSLIARRADLYTLKLGHSVPIFVDDVHVLSMGAMSKAGARKTPIPERDAFEPGAFAWLRHFCDTGMFLSENGRESFQVPRAWMALSGCHGPALSGPWKMSSRLTRHMWVACMGEWTSHLSPTSLFMYQISSPILKSAIEHELKTMIQSVSKGSLLPTLSTVSMRAAWLDGEENELDKAAKEEELWIQMCADALNTAILELGSRMSSVLTVDSLETPRAVYPTLRSLMYALQDMGLLLKHQTVARRRILPNSMPRVAASFVYCFSSVLGNRIGDATKVDELLEGVVSVAIKTLVPLDRNLVGTIALDSESLTTEHLESVAHRGFVTRDRRVVAEDPRIQFESLHGALMQRRMHPAFEVVVTMDGADQTTRESCFKRAISRMLLPDIPTKIYRLAFALEQPVVTDYMCLAGAPGSGRRSALRMASALIDARYLEVNRVGTTERLLEHLAFALDTAAEEGKRVVLCLRCDVQHLAAFVPIVQLITQGALPLSMQPVAEPDMARDSERSSPHGPSKLSQKALERTQEALSRLRIVLMLDNGDLSEAMGRCPALVSRARIVNFSAHSNEDLVAAITVAIYNLPLIAQVRTAKGQNRRASMSIANESDADRNRKEASRTVRLINEQFDQMICRDIDIQKLSKLAAQIHDASCVYLEAMGASPGTYAPTKVLQMLSTYMCVMDMQEVTLRENFVASRWALQEIDHLHDMLDDMQEREQFLAPQLADVIASASDVLMEVNVLSHELDDASRKLDLEHSRVEEALGTIRDLIGAAEADMHMVQAAYRHIVTEITELRDEDLHEIRSYMGHSPPALIRNVVLACCCVFGMQEEWEVARKLITDTDRTLAMRISRFDVTLVGEKKLARLRKYIELPNFKPAAVAQVSRAIRSVCEWVLRVYDYGSARLMVETRSVKIVEGQSRIDRAKEYVTVREETVVALQGRIKGLRAKREALVDRQGELETELGQLRENMEIVQEALEFLQTEEGRWHGALKALAAFTQELRGNAMLSAASVIYLGQLRPDARAELQGRWIEIARELRVPFSRDFSIATFLEEGGVKIFPAGGALVPHSAMNNLLMTMLVPGPVLVVDSSGEAQGRLLEMQNDRLWHTVDIATGTTLKELPGSLQVLKTGGLVLGVMQESIGPEPAYRWLRSLHQFTSGGLDLLEEAKRAVKKQVFLATLNSAPEVSEEFAGHINVIRFDVQRDEVEERLLSELMKLRDPESEDLLRRLEVSVMSQYHAVRRLMAQLTDMIGDMDDRSLRERSVIQSIVEKLQLLRDLETQLSHDRRRMQSLRTYSDIERAIAVLAGQVFVFLQDAAINAPTVGLTLREFIHVFKAAAEVMFKIEESNVSPGQTTARKRTPLGAKLLDGVTAQLRRFAQELFTRLSGRMSPSESALLGVMVSLLLLLDDGLIAEDERKFTLVKIAELLRNSLRESSAVAASGDLKALLVTALPAVHALVESYPNRVAVLGLEDSIATNPEMWARVLEEPLPPAALGHPWSARLSPSLKVLLFCTIIKEPAFLERMISWLVHQVLNNPVPGSPAHMLRDLCDLLPPSIPVLLYEEADGSSFLLPSVISTAHALALQTHYTQSNQTYLRESQTNGGPPARRRSLTSGQAPNPLSPHPDIIHVHLSAVTVSTFIASVRMAMVAGLWVVAYDIHNDLTWEPMLRSILLQQIEEIRPGFRILLCVRDQDVSLLPRSVFNWCVSVSGRMESTPAEMIARCMLTVSHDGIGLGVKDNDLQRMLAIRWLGLCLLHTSLVCGWLAEPMTGSCGVGVSGEDLLRLSNFLAARTENFSEMRGIGAIQDFAREVITQMYSLPALHCTEQERLALILADLWAQLNTHLTDSEVESVRKAFVTTRGLHIVCEMIAPILTDVFDRIGVRHDCLMLLSRVVECMDPFKSSAFAAHQRPHTGGSTGGRPSHPSLNGTEASGALVHATPQPGEAYDRSLGALSPAPPTDGHATPSPSRGQSPSPPRRRSLPKGRPTTAQRVRPGDSLTYMEQSPYSLAWGSFHGCAGSLLDMLLQCLPSTLQEHVMASAPLTSAQLMRPLTPVQTRPSSGGGGAEARAVSQMMGKSFKASAASAKSQSFDSQQAGVALGMLGLGGYDPSTKQILVRQDRSLNKSLLHKQLEGGEQSRGLMSPRANNSRSDLTSTKSSVFAAAAGAAASQRRLVPSGLSNAAAMSTAHPAPVASNIPRQSQASSKAARARRRSSLALPAELMLSGAGGGEGSLRATSDENHMAHVQVVELLMEEAALVRELLNSCTMAPIRCQGLTRAVDGLPPRLVRALVLSEALLMGRTLSTWADIIAVTLATRGFVATNVPSLSANVQEGKLALFPGESSWVEENAGDVLHELKRKFWAVSAAAEGRQNFLWDLANLSNPNALVTSAWIASLGPDATPEDRGRSLLALHPEELAPAPSAGHGYASDPGDGGSTFAGPLLTSLAVNGARWDSFVRTMVRSPGAFCLPTGRLRSQTPRPAARTDADAAEVDVEVLVNVKALDNTLLFTMQMPADRHITRAVLSIACHVVQTTTSLGRGSGFSGGS